MSVAGLPAAAATSGAPASAAWPMGYLHTFGPRADPATALTWGLLDISIAVIAVITFLVAAGVVVRRARASLPAVSEPSGAAWITIGVGLTVVVLAACLLWTVRVVAEIDSPALRPDLTLQVDARRWWWRLGYPGVQGGAGGFFSANEIHIPVGRPVLVELTSPDVIHSFWVPALTGKTETIPGRTNISWMQADQPGAFRGQCTEYCGVQHAQMALVVVAQPQAEFDAWRAAQAAPAAQPDTAETRQGEAVFEVHCAVCHTVRGSLAHGQAGPDLTHLMSRGTIASGILPNTTGSLSGWISDPQALKPGALMPATDLSGPQLGEVVAYLETLK
ncbi:MAG: c-type cytochrome [Caulobacteraceae bacterium]|nr:c-type cytochrome [Caulobacteraceae bacterium]